MSIKNYKLVVVAFLLGNLIAACTSSKKSTATVDRSDLKGTWSLDNINYEGLPANQKLKLTLLDEGTDDCLRGSTWVLPNNGNGSYTIAQNAPGCAAGQRNIVWSYRDEGGRNIFQFKKLTGGVKPKDINEGYKFNIVTATDNGFQLQSLVNFEGKVITINYYFIKK
jgi:hypothetical protein